MSQPPPPNDPYTVMLYERIRDQNEILVELGVRLNKQIDLLDHINSKLLFIAVLIAAAFVLFASVLGFAGYTLFLFIQVVRNASFS